MKENKEEKLEQKPSIENKEEQDKSKSDELNNLTYEELLEKVDALKEEALRAAAELENHKKRTANELINALRYANSELLMSLIPIITSIEKALDNSENEKQIDREGILLILDSFEKTLENFNIVPIKPTGEEFDPEKHEAVSTVSNSEEKDNIVSNTLERGWSLNERVIKPALVVVNKNN